MLLTLSRTPEYTASVEDNIPQGSGQAMGGGWCKYFMVNNETLLCIVDYYSKFPVVKKMESM